MNPICLLGRQVRLSVYVFHGAGVALQSPMGVVPVLASAEPNAVAVGLLLAAGSGGSWRR